MAGSTEPVVIERLVVEGGFLDGLDLRFSEGLNVLIGERGAGKTSVIELLRFALGTSALTERFARLAREHTASVLGEGRVSVSYRVGGESRSSSRRIGDSEPEADGPLPPASPIVLSQNEIEAVGLDANGRLRLIDGFRRRNDSAGPATASSLAASIRSLSVELQALDREIEDMQERLSDREATQRELDDALVELSHHEVSAARITSQMPELDRLADESASRSVGVTELERVLQSLRAWRERLQDTVQAAPSVAAEGSSIAASAFRASDVVQRAVSDLQSIAGNVAAEETYLGDRLQADKAALVELNDRARSLRLELERTQAGAGTAVRRVSDLKEAIAQLDALSQRLQQTSLRRRTLEADRSALLDQLDDLRNARYEDRAQIAAEISSTLGPRIRASVNRSGIRTGYAQAIVELLKGSGLRYAQLAPALAAALPPRELVQAVEHDDVAKVRTMVDLTTDRAERLFYALRSSDLASLLTTELPDSVSLQLLDGSEYKPTPVLSTGQRCTVVLPILLRHDERPLVIDQPEDHLDNAYVVDTLVRAVSARVSGSQLIVSTHNPNIPVLGEASQVVLLGSDGRRGFVRFSGALGDARIVDAITTIMEGGAEAFRRRAAFYEQVPS